MSRTLKKIICLLLSCGLCFSGVFAGCASPETNDANTGGISDGGNGETGGDSIDDDGGQQYPSEDTEDKTAYYVRTDKDVYYAGESIRIIAGGGENTAVGVYADNGSTQPIAEYFVNKNGMRSGKGYVIGSTGALATGEYIVALNESDGKEKAVAEFAVVEHALSTDKSTYYQNEDIVVTAVGTGSAWVGLYKSDETPGDTPSICWYYVDKETRLSGQSYILQRSAKYNKSGFDVLPAGEYKLVMFANDSQSSVVAQKRITVIGGSTGRATAPISAEYAPDDPKSGCAGGTLTVTFGQDFSASELVAAWADADGELKDYARFDPQKVTGQTCIFPALEGVAIPAAATKLRLYGKNVNGLSSDWCEVDLPERQKQHEGALLHEFNVISDIHLSMATTHNGKTFYNDNFARACEDIVSVSPNSEGVFIVGDIANSGLSSEWAKAEEILSSVNGMPKAYYAVGNHDLYENNVAYSEKIKDFLRYSGQQKAYYEAVVNGVHHIVLGSQSQQTDTASPTGNRGVDAIMYDDQIDWLDERLHAITSAEPNKPVFVYCHQSMYNTVAGSLKGHKWNGVRPEDKLRAVFAKYTQVLLFNGHSHWVMQSYRNAYLATNELPNIFNTSATSYLWSTADNEVSVAGSQGYYVKVYENEIRVYGRDFANSVWIPEACYVVTIE